VKRMCREDERPGLQALLRGATESHALLPDDSPYIRSVEVLQAGVIEMLAELDRRTRFRRPDLRAQRSRGEAA
jgi:hypothetical protein